MLIKHVPIDMRFNAVTRSGRVLLNAKVRRTTELDSPHKHEVLWFDENGKHYEWFNLNDTAREFREFEIIGGLDA